MILRAVVFRLEDIQETGTNESSQLIHVQAGALSGDPAKISSLSE